MTTTLLHRDQDKDVYLKLQDNEVLLTTVERDDAILESNRRLRASGLLSPGKGAALGQPEGSKVIYWFQAPPAAWARFRRKKRQLYLALHSHDQLVRERAAAEIARTHPEWIAMAPKEVARG